MWGQTAQDLVQDAMQKQQAGDLEGAVNGYRRFLKIHPEATAIHSNLGAALAGLGRFAEAVTGGCTCPPGLPCVCGARPRGRLVGRGARRPSAVEVEANPRAGSARLRALERLDDSRSGS